MSVTQPFRNFDDFYSFYLSEHSDRSCRRLHFVGSTLALMCFATAILNGLWWLVLVGIVIGYGFAWVGHFFFERNKPATFKYPWLSFRGDWRMYRDIATGRIAF